MINLTINTPQSAKSSAPKQLIRLEGIAAFATAVALYSHLEFGWGLFALLFFAPDVAMIGYAINTRMGAILYNLFHTYTVPMGLAGVGILFATPLALQIALVWLAHIGFDRTIGYGLKYADEFKNTHLNNI